MNCPEAAEKLLQAKNFIKINWSSGSLCVFGDPEGEVLGDVAI